MKTPQHGHINLDKHKINNMKTKLQTVLRFICLWVVNIIVGAISILMDLIYYPIFTIIYVFYVLYQFGNNEKILNLYRFITDKIHYNIGLIYLIRLTLGYEHE